MVLTLVGAPRADAHSFDPGLLDVRERGAGSYDVVWRPPVALAVAALGREAEPRFPERCRRLPSDARLAARGDVDAFELDCGPQGLAGAALTLPAGDDGSIEALVRIRWLGGETTSATLGSGGALEIHPPGEGTRAGDRAETLAIAVRRAVAASLGELIASPDHLLFLLALFILIDGSRALWKTLAGFVVGQSLTLALAATGSVTVAAPPIEALVAASIVLLAAEIARPAGRTSLARRAPWLAAAALGLLHGFAMAGGFAASEPPHAQLAPALIAFNLGALVGQIGFVALLAAGLAGLRRLRLERPWARLVPAYALGSIAAAWTIERVIRCFAPGS